MSAFAAVHSCSMLAVLVVPLAQLLHLASDIHLMTGQQCSVTGYRCK